VTSVALRPASAKSTNGAAVHANTSFGDVDGPSTSSKSYQFFSTCARCSSKCATPSPSAALEYKAGEWHCGWTRSTTRTFARSRARVSEPTRVSGMKHLPPKGRTTD